MSFYLPYQFSSTPIATGNANPFDIDPEQTVPIATGNANPFGIDPDQTDAFNADDTVLTVHRCCSKPAIPSCSRPAIPCCSRGQQSAPIPLASTPNGHR